MPLLVLRCVFMMVAIGVATLFVGMLKTYISETYVPWLIFVGILGLAGAVIGADIFIPRKQIDIISGVYFGLLIGTFLTYMFMLALQPLLGPLPENKLAHDVAQLLIGMILCYTCISVLLQTKDDFRFIIPYVEFAKEVKGLKPYILDTSVVIDGRIADLAETNILDSQLIMPRFVLGELQAIADSSDKLRRARGRRGLDMLNKLRNNPAVDLKIFDRELPELANQAVDMKLVLLAKHLGGKVVTGDYNLNKVAKLHNVQVVNLNDISNSLKPVFLPGESVAVRIVKAGEEMGQGVGYLDDGTMIVVEGGRDHVGKEVKISVTSVLQNSAGRMIFGKYSAA
ncbi:PIN/TRAM domain-containing protein [Anatilimnocola floriformis]|uniref:PIN/TRAM domain-containing protein n=1 Tax=Anatilimnocola floriformis TaxID=2948575 RepID=UPI0020C47B08|nr:PIN domain-containing protein [Anatilimnocola floriformis]